MAATKKTTRKKAPRKTAPKKVVKKAESVNVEEEAKAVELTDKEKAKMHLTDRAFNHYCRLCDFSSLDTHQKRMRFLNRVHKLELTEEQMV